MHCSMQSLTNWRVDRGVQLTHRRPHSGLAVLNVINWSPASSVDSCCCCCCPAAHSTCSERDVAFYGLLISYRDCRILVSIGLYAADAPTPWSTKPSDWLILSANTPHRRPSPDRFAAVSISAEIKCARQHNINYIFSRKWWQFGLSYGLCVCVCAVPKFFHCQISEEILYTHNKDSPPHLRYVSTLTCEAWQLQLLPISMAYSSSELILQDMRPP